MKNYDHRYSGKDRPSAGRNNFHRLLIQRRRRHQQGHKNGFIKPLFYKNIAVYGNGNCAKLKPLPQLKTHQMIKKILIITAAVILSGCATGFHHIAPNNEKVSFSNPVLEDGGDKNLTYVLLEKSLTDDSYRLVEISKVKPQISNRQQERIVFNGNLTRYAVDYDEYEFENFVDHQNYGQITKIMVCEGKYKSVKTSRYNPCSSDFKTPFIPMGITKAYVAGRMPYEARRLWDNPNYNKNIEVRNPWSALRTSGAIEKLGIKKVEAK